MWVAFYRWMSDGGIIIRTWQNFIRAWDAYSGRRLRDPRDGPDGGPGGGPGGYYGPGGPGGGPRGPGGGPGGDPGAGPSGPGGQAVLTDPTIHLTEDGGDGDAAAVAVRGA